MRSINNPPKSVSKWPLDSWAR